jgi:hypothetical protein
VLGGAGLGGGGLGGGLGLGRRLGLVGGNIEDVQNATSGWLGGRVFTWVVGDMVAIDNVVVPVSLTSLEHRALELECSLPCAGLGGVLVLSKRKLASVIVPRTEKMYGLNTGGCAQRERKLNGCHC